MVIFCVVHVLTTQQHSLWAEPSLVPGHYSDLSRSRGEKSGEVLGSSLHHRPEMVDLVSPPFLVHDVAIIPGLLPIFLHGCEIKSGSGLGMRLD